MAVIAIKANFADLDIARAGIKTLPEALQAKYVGAAVREAIKPAVARLKQLTPRGPTGNLQRAIASKVVTYPQDGNAVALAGYVRAGKSPSVSAQGGKVRAGKDRAFHQGLLEFGTDQRVISKQSPYGGFIASSFKSLGPFRILASGSNGTFTTRPAYPKAFFMKKNKPVVIRPTRAQAPIKNAYNDTWPQMGQILADKLSTGLENAIKEIEYRKQGYISPTK
jgi:hypothetical protein